MSLALRVGITPDIFWNITPWQLKIAMETHDDKKADEHDHFAWLMWHGALLFRSGAKKLPELKTFLTKRDQDGDEKKKPVAGINEGAIMAWLAGAKASFDKKKASKP